MNRVVPTFILAIALTACGGGGQTADTVVPKPNAPPASTGSKAASVALTITVPRSASPQSGMRRPAYVSPATQSIVVTPQGAAAQTFTVTQSSPGCTNSGGTLTCTFSVSAPTGQNETITISTFASADGSGTPLSTAAVVISVVQGQTNPVKATLNGVVASLTLALSPASVTAGTTAPVSVTVNALDASGSTIVGPGSYVDANGNPLTVTLGSNTSTYSFSRTTVNAPGQAVTLTYNGRATKNLYVSDFICSCVYVYGPSATYESVPVLASSPGVLGVATQVLTLTPATSGNVAPLRSLQIFGPFNNGRTVRGIALDSGGNFYVTDTQNNTIDVYAPGASGQFPPTIRSISGGNTGLGGPYGITFDQSGNLYVANAQINVAGATGSVTVYGPGATGNATPNRNITGNNTMLTSAQGVTVDAGGTLYVGNVDRNGCAPNYTVVFAPGANNNATPARQLTSLPCPALGQIALGGSPVALYEANNNQNEIDIFDPTAAGSTPPRNMIAGSNTQLSGPNGLAVDLSNYVYVSNQSGSTITVYAPGATGNVAPLSTIAGSNTGLNQPIFLAIGP